MAWSKSLLLVLENNTRVKEVENLMSVLLMEADFNFLNKILIGVYMMRVSENESVIPPCQYRGWKVQR